MENDQMNIKDMNIFQKLLNITNEISNVNKNLTVGQGKNAYKAVGEADVLKAVKELEFKYGVYSYPFSREVLESSMYTTTNEYGEKNNIFSRLKTVYRFVNADKPDEYIETTTFAEGIDTQDKGSGKAMTYSDKYALMKTYKIITGEDPDQNPSETGYDKKLTSTKGVKNKVTDVEAKSIYSLMLRKGYDVVPTLEKFFKVKNTADLTKAQYLEIVKHCNTLPDKEKTKEQKEREILQNEMMEAYYDTSENMGDR